MESRCGRRMTWDSFDAFMGAQKERDQSSNRPTATDTLCPPNPNVLFNANRTVRSRAVWGVKSNPANSSSGLSQLIVGGTTPSRQERTLKTVSNPPAAPRVWPIMLLVLQTEIDGA